MIFAGSLVMGEVIEGKNKGLFRGVCLRCDSRYTASSKESLENALGRHTCDPFKHPILHWIGGLERHEGV